MSVDATPAAHFHTPRRIGGRTEQAAGWRGLDILRSFSRYGVARRIQLVRGVRGRLAAVADEPTRLQTATPCARRTVENGRAEPHEIWIEHWVLAATIVRRAPHQGHAAVPTRWATSEGYYDKPSVASFGFASASRHHHRAECPQRNRPR